MPDIVVPMNIAYVADHLDTEYDADEHGFPVEAFTSGVLYYFQKGTGGSSGASLGTDITAGVAAPGPYYDSIGTMLGGTPSHGTLAVGNVGDGMVARAYGLEVPSGSGIWIDTGKDFAGSGTIIWAGKLTGQVTTASKTSLFRPAVNVPAASDDPVTAFTGIHPAMSRYNAWVDTVPTPNRPFDDSLFIYDHSLLLTSPQIRPIPKWRVSASQPQVICCRWNGATGRIEVFTMVGGGYKVLTNAALIGHWAGFAPSGQNMIVGLTPTVSAGVGPDRDSKGELYTIAYQPSFVTDFFVHMAMRSMARRLFYKASITVQGYLPEIK